MSDIYPIRIESYLDKIQAYPKSDKNFNDDVLYSHYIQLWGRMLIRIRIATLTLTEIKRKHKTKHDLLKYMYNIQQNI